MGGSLTQPGNPQHSHKGCRTLGLLEQAGLGAPVLAGRCPCHRQPGLVPGVATMPRVGGRGEDAPHTPCPSFPYLAPRISCLLNGVNSFHPLQMYAPHRCVLGGLNNNLDRTDLQHQLIFSRPFHPHHPKPKTPRRRTCPTMQESKRAKASQGGWRTGGPLQTPSRKPTTSAAHDQH